MNRDGRAPRPLARETGYRASIGTFLASHQSELLRCVMTSRHITDIYVS